MRGPAERAIELAWRLVTKEFGVPADRLMVTVYIARDSRRVRSHHPHGWAGRGGWRAGHFG
jgi:alanyl-tRNA synthetase